MHSENWFYLQGISMSSLDETKLASAIREKLQVEDDNDDQDILDQHVSRVFSDLPHTRSPGITSPSRRG